MAEAYVYGLFDGDTVAYIGKGTGRRLKNQERHYRLSGRVLKVFKSEAEAFAFEREMIAQCKPLLNKCPGGNGGTKKKRRLRRTKLEMLTEQIGGRAVSARMLLAVRVRRPDLVTADRETLVAMARLDVVDLSSGRPVNPFALQ